MRVIAGTLGGRRISAPAGSATRPTAELVRAAIFNSLDAQGVLQGARVVDLFAGSGALGIEALSRGASASTFVEADARAVEVIKANLAALGLRGPVVRSTAERWAARAHDPVDIVLADPPYVWDSWDQLMHALVRFPVERLVAESDRPLQHPWWEVVASKRHGDTVVTQFRRRQEQRET